MSRGGRGAGRGGGRGGFGRGAGGQSAPPMGLTFADLQTLSREPSALYPSMDPLPVLNEYGEEDKRIARLQAGFASRLRKSPYYIVENKKSTDLPRYSDKYRPSTKTQPVLKKSDLYQPFFPVDIFDDYFHPKKKRKTARRAGDTVNLDELEDDPDEGEKSGGEASNAGSLADEDYDVDEEYDNDYAENYFDNGENDDFDDLGGGGGGGEDGGGAADYD